jgi:hypothetical protein
VVETRDRIAGTDLFLTILSGSLTLNRGPWHYEIWSKQRHTLELFTGGTQRSVEVGVRIRGSQIPMSPSLDFSVRRAETTHILTASLSLGAISLSLEMENLFPTFTLTYETDFPITFPWWPVKGQLEGRVFVDSNTNRFYDRNEEGLPDLILSLDDVQALSGGQGQFRFSPLSEGIYSLFILNLPRKYVPLVKLPVRVHLEAGVVEQIEVPVVEAATITGRVAIFSRNQENSDESYREGDHKNATGQLGEQGEGVPGVFLKLTNGIQKFSQATDRNGYFHFDQLLPGHWTLSVPREQLPAHHELEQDVFEFDLEPGECVELVIKVFPVFRPIRMIEEKELEGKEEDDQ